MAFIIDVYTSIEDAEKEEKAERKEIEQLGREALAAQEERRKAHAEEQAKKALSAFSKQFGQKVKQQLGPPKKKKKSKSKDKKEKRRSKTINAKRGTELLKRNKEKPNGINDSLANDSLISEISEEQQLENTNSPITAAP